MNKFSYPLLSGGYLRRRHFLAFVNKATVNMDVQISLWEDVQLFGFPSGSDTRGSGHSSDFRFLINLHDNFHSVCNSLYFSVIVKKNVKRKVLC